MSERATTVHRASSRPPRTQRADRPTATLIGLGTAVPELSWPQWRVRDVMADAWELRGRALGRWRRIADHAGIEQRFGVLPIDQVWGLSTGQRMTVYEQQAPPLAFGAARRALEQAGVGMDEITDLIVVSCTGFAAPGLDVALIERLSLPENVRRLSVGFMGCYGAITGLRAAIGVCTADPRAVTLIVCCELCSLHVRPEPDVDNQVATALFGDGAAAAVVHGEQARSARTAREHGGGTTPLGRLALGATRLLPEGKSWMTWRITDAGFTMTIDRQVPGALGAAIESFIGESSAIPPATLAVHPGGPGVLDAVEAALAAPVAGMAHSRAILRECGNMSSGTVLFVLERLLGAGESLPGLLVAFGPGLTMEGLPVMPIASPLH